MNINNCNRIIIYVTDPQIEKLITTNSNGEASRIYNSQGVGDVEFVACNPNMNLQATYNLKDCAN